MVAPVVDVIIAVHSRTRPIARAVASVVEHTHAPTRVNVVAHNIDPAIIHANLGNYASHPTVRLLPFRDEIPSPAGPMNHGLDHASAPFTTLLGSDDEFAPGAIDSWLTLQRQTGADAVLAQVRLPDGSRDPYPPVRNGRRTRNLNAYKDRLFFRSAPLGLISRNAFPDLRFAEGLRSGEDLPYSATIWTQGKHLAYSLSTAGYVVNDDVEDRVTHEPRPFIEDFRFLDVIERLPWFAAAPSTVRSAFVVKVLRIHVFDAILARHTIPDARKTLAADLNTLLARLERMAPDALRLLPLADRRLLDAALRRDDDSGWEDLISARLSYRSFGALVPRNPFLILHRHAPLRTLLAGFLASRRT